MVEMFDDSTLPIDKSYFGFLILFLFIVLTVMYLEIATDKSYNAACGVAAVLSCLTSVNVTAGIPPVGMALVCNAVHAVSQKLRHNVT
ncbi:hypothetical protein GSS88_05880 [Corynebacterium sp. 3HC-13]|uniref:hypothetical protein n=1 Tax=Corynebacterium poyangense TaxID=2684405 RepID=UPI001CCD6D76|nr:hypothetical protein [Corynebacterium poyangense]MBZ8177326.1 hypothetical protein [Corynebacterium poyangense]